MILYHGTTAPLNEIKTKGLRIFGVKWLHELMVSRAKDPAKLGPIILRILTSIREPAFGIYLSTDPEMGKTYIGIPEELGFPFLMRPLKLSQEILKTLVEVEGDVLIGKLVTLNIPDSWKDDPRTNFDNPDEIIIPWDIGPQYITNIEIVSRSWREAWAYVRDMIE